MLPYRCAGAGSVGILFFLPMQLSCKIRIYEDAGRYVSVLVMPKGMISGVGQSLSQALASLAEAVGRESESSTLERPRKSMSTSDSFHSSSPPASGYVPKVKRLLAERFGNLTLRQLADRLELYDVSTALLSASIRGQGARRVRLAIAAALGEEPARLWPLAPNEA